MVRHVGGFSRFATREVVGARWPQTATRKPGVRMSNGSRTTGSGSATTRSRACLKREVEAAFVMDALAMRAGSESREAEASAKTVLTEVDARLLEPAIQAM